MKKYIALSIIALSSSVGMARNLNELPKEMQVLILSSADLPSILRFCQTSNEKKKLCEKNKEVFFEILSTRQYPNELRPKDMSWEEFYFQKAANREFPTANKPENSSWKEFYTSTYDLYIN